MLPAVGKLRVFSLSLQDLLHVLHVDALVLVIELFLFVELLVEFGLVVGLNLEYSNLSILHWSRHHLESLLL